MLHKVRNMKRKNNSNGKFENQTEKKLTTKICCTRRCSDFQLNFCSKFPICVAYPKKAKGWGEGGEGNVRVRGTGSAAHICRAWQTPKANKFPRLVFYSISVIMCLSKLILIEFIWLSENITEQRETEREHTKRRGKKLNKKPFIIRICFCFLLCHI